MATDNGASTALPRRRSRITRGSKLLPSVHEQSVWARVMRDVLDAVTSHCGARKTSPSCTLIHIEDRIARAHAAGEEPAPADLDLYGRLANGQRRHCEALGWERTQRDVTHTVIEVIRQKAREMADEEHTDG